MKAFRITRAKRHGKLLIDAEKTLTPIIVTTITLRI